MRLFTAIDLGDAVQAEAVALVAELRGRAGRAAPDAKLTWVAPDRMHLTLRFIGDVSEEEGARILGALRAPLDELPFIVRWGGLGAFPRTGAPRVLWAGIEAGQEPLKRVEAEITARLAALGIPQEDRSYKPHLSLARVRDAAGLRTHALLEGLSGRLGETRVAAITLFQSHLSPKGSTYVTLQKTRLRPPGSGLQE